MRLLNAETLQLEDFFEAETVPPYYILSHRWEGDEISYKDFQKSRKNDSRGYKKVAEFCKFALDRRQNQHASDPCYVWVDTCCIDKRSSSELSHAINSMYDWYKTAISCIVLLSDVSYGSEAQIRESVWFKRGWTLQELLAPAFVTFVDQKWQILGHKCSESCNCSLLAGHEESGVSLNLLLESITGIQATYLENPRRIRVASIARRMSWAAKRRTTRVEDSAYCLLGLFDVNMPLLYGEGRKSFGRLQEAIIQRSTDHSIFAWSATRCASNTFIPGIFAREVSDFKNSGGLETIHPISSVTWPYTLTNFALELRAPMELVRLKRPTFEGIAEGYLVLLNCTSNSLPVWLLLVERKDHNDPLAPRYFTSQAVLIGRASVLAKVERLDDAKMSVHSLFVQPFDIAALPLATASEQVVDTAQSSHANKMIAIDYGTTFTGLAYAVGLANEASHLTTSNWPAIPGLPSPHTAMKVPSSISYPEESLGNLQWGHDIDDRSVKIIRTKLELDL